MKIAYIIRGLPGSGKSTLAHDMGALPVAADDYRDYTKPYDPSQNTLAHTLCLKQWKQWVSEGMSPIAVTNIFRKIDEFLPYYEYASDGGYRVYVLDLFHGGMTSKTLSERGLHSVPEETIERLRNTWEC